MTAKREAELETENRMLRERVESLERIIERMQCPPAVLPVPAVHYYPGWCGTWYWPVTATYEANAVVAAGGVSGTLA